MSKIGSKTAAIVVTYNRKDLLAQCLDAIDSQSVKPDKVIVVDNCSTDGTEEYVRNCSLYQQGSIEYLKLSSNTGGSGGFHAGMEKARQSDYDWFWLMDDDTICNPDTLKNLLEAAEKPAASVSALASCVFGQDGQAMNVPNISTMADSNGYPDWYRFLDSGLVAIADATFVSLLISRKAVDKCGLPCPDYFLWGDDTEYTMRIIKNYGPAYLVGNSSVIHKRKNNGRLSIKQETETGRIELYRYFFRNILINKRMYASVSALLRFYFGALRTSITSLFTEKGWLKFVTVHKGIIGFFQNYGRFKAYVDDQLKGNR